MDKRGRARPRPALITSAFVALAVITAVLLVYTGKWLFAAAGKQSTDYLAKLGELTLQLALVAVIGGLLKILIAWGAAFKARQIAQNEKRMDLLRRVRSIHMTIENARELLIAHHSAKTYTEQLRRLMALRPEVEEISEEVNDSGPLFRNREEIRSGLEHVAAYLKSGADEYIAEHGRVLAADPTKLSEAIRANNMIWVRDLMDTGANYNERYAANLVRVKRNIRVDTYHD